MAKYNTSNTNKNRQRNKESTGLAYMEQTNKQRKQSNRGGCSGGGRGAEEGRNITMAVNSTNSERWEEP